MVKNFKNLVGPVCRVMVSVCEKHPVEIKKKKDSFICKGCKQEIKHYAKGYCVKCYNIYKSKGKTIVELRQTGRPPRMKKYFFMQQKIDRLMYGLHGRRNQIEILESIIDEAKKLIDEIQVRK